MGGFLGFGGNKNIDKGMKEEKNLFNYALGTSKDLQKTATSTTNLGLDTMKSSLSTLDEVKKYFQDIMSGNRPAQFAAVQPEINAINEQADAARTQAANMGTARGGGVAATSANADAARMKLIDDALFGIRPQAATGVERIGGEQAQVGQAQANVGLDQLSAALRALGLSDEAIAHYTEAAFQKKKNDVEKWNNVLDFATGFAGGMGW